MQKKKARLKKLRNYPLLYTKTEEMCHYESKQSGKNNILPLWEDRNLNFEEGLDSGKSHNTNRKIPIHLFNTSTEFTPHPTLRVTLSHSAYSLTRLILRLFELASHKGRGKNYNKPDSFGLNIRMTVQITVMYLKG